MLTPGIIIPEDIIIPQNTRYSEFFKIKVDDILKSKVFSIKSNDNPNKKDKNIGINIGIKKFFISFLRLMIKKLEQDLAFFV